MAIDGSSISFLRPSNKSLNEDCQTKVVEEIILAEVLLVRLKSHHGVDPIFPSCLLLSTL